MAYREQYATAGAAVDLHEPQLKGTSIEIYRIAALLSGTESIEQVLEVSRCCLDGSSSLSVQKFPKLATFVPGAVQRRRGRTSHA
jgi:hypothetical protein